MNALVLAGVPRGACQIKKGVRLRVIDAHIAVTVTGLRLQGHYRLATTFLDHRRHPAAELVTLYHEHWEIESAFYSLRHTLQAGLAPRPQDPVAVQQELWAHLAVYQALRRTMAEAAETRPDTDPDRVSFTVALETAKDQVIAAAGVLPDAEPGRIGQAVLDREPSQCFVEGDRLSGDGHAAGVALPCARWRRPVRSLASSVSAVLITFHPTDDDIAGGVRHGAPAA